MAYFRARALPVEKAGWPIMLPAAKWQIISSSRCVCVCVPKVREAGRVWVKAGSHRVHGNLLQKVTICLPCLVPSVSQHPPPHSYITYTPPTEHTTWKSSHAYRSTRGPLTKPTPGGGGGTQGRCAGSRRHATGALKPPCTMEKKRRWSTQVHEEGRRSGTDWTLLLTLLRLTLNILTPLGRGFGKVSGLFGSSSKLIKKNKTSASLNFKKEKVQYYFSCLSFFTMCMNLCSLLNTFSKIW